MLEIRLGSDDVLLPLVGITDVLAEGSVEALCVLLLHHALAVGRIADHDARLAGQIHLGGIAVTEGDAVSNTGLSCVGDGKADALGVVVGAQDLVLALEFLVLCFSANVAPNIGGAPGECLAHEAAVHTGSLITGNQSSLDGNGTGTAEGIPEELAAAITGQHDHSGSQSFTQRCIVADGTVAALVEAGTGGIQVQSDLVSHDGKLQLILGAGFGQPAYTVLFTQTAGSGFLDDGLAVGNGHQLGVQAVALDGELAILGDEIFQIGAVNALEQLFEGGSLEGCQHQQNTLAGTQADVCLGHGTLVTGEEDAAVFDPDIFNIQAAQFVAGDAFQTKKTRNRKFKFIHKYSFLLCQGIIFFGFRYRSCSEKTQPQYFWMYIPSSRAFSWPGRK